MTDKTLPTSVKTQALHAVASIHAWNAAVHQVRAQEALDGCPGRYEYKIMTDKEHIPMRLAVGHAHAMLDVLVDSMRAQGWSPQDFYTALGTERPSVVEEGPKVVTWREGTP